MQGIRIGQKHVLFTWVHYCTTCKRFFASGEVGSRHPELLGLITGSIYSNLHVPVSEELALANPELTLPLFSGE